MEPSVYSLLVGMHLNKALYTFSYMCVTAGVAGILFVGIYLMVGSLSALLIL